MSAKFLDFLEFSTDDPLWVARAPKDSFFQVEADVDAEVQSGSVADWDVPATKTVTHVHLLGPAKGALLGDTCLIQGINHTGVINALIAEQPQGLMSVATVDILRKMNLQAQAKAVTAMASVRPVNRSAFMDHMKKRRIDITVLRTEGLVLIHFPVWEKTDAPNMTPVQRKAHKQSYISFAAGKAVDEAGFQTDILTAIRDDIAALPTQAEKDARCSIRAYEFENGMFVEKPATETLDQFIQCSCSNAKPSTISMPAGDDDCEACEMMVCEIVNDDIVCHIISTKPYACPVHP